MKSVLCLLVAVSATLWFAGCGDDNKKTEQPVPSKPEVPPEKGGPEPEPDPNDP